MSIIPPLQEIQRALTSWDAYQKALIRKRDFIPLMPTAIGIKVASNDEFTTSANELMLISNQVHIGRIDDRWISSFLLNKTTETSGIPIIKLMQRRPSSNDPLGLDHFDFYCPELDVVQDALESSNANWQAESNDAHQWLSVRYGEDLQYEAKLLDHTVLQAGINELVVAQQSILKGSK